MKMAAKTPVGVILGAARVSEELVPVFGDIPSSLIPLNGKPAVYFILDHLRALGLRKVYVSVGYKEERVRRILDAYAAEKNFEIVAAPVDAAKRPGSALIQIYKRMSASERKSGALVHLADTLPAEKKFSFKKDFILVSSDYQDSKRWCVVETEAKTGNVRRLLDKQEGQEGKLAAVGIYYFSDVTSFLKLSGKNYEISDLFRVLIKKKKPVSALLTKKWMDLGHIGKYYEAKAALLPSRSFNMLSGNRSGATIIKRSERPEIIKNEVGWYLAIPKRLSVYAPRVIEHSFKKGDTFAELEFYGYPALSELWLYAGLGVPLWELVIDRLFSVLQEFRAHRGEVLKRDYAQMYVEKTMRRIKEAGEKNQFLKMLFSAPEVSVNGILMPGWPHYEERLAELTKKLYNREDNAFLHGDFHFSNTL